MNYSYVDTGLSPIYIHKKHQQISDDRTKQVSVTVHAQPRRRHRLASGLGDQQKKQQNEPVVIEAICTVSPKKESTVLSA